MDSVKLCLTTPQMNSYKNGKTFQLSHQQLSGHSKGKHDIVIQLPNHHTQILMKHISMGKGHRFPSQVTGGGIKENVKDVFKKVTKFIKPVLPVVKDIVEPVIKDVARNALKTYIQSRIPVQGGALKDGIPLPLYSAKTTERIMTHGLSHKMSGTKNGLLHGGSFLPLGN